MSEPVLLTGATGFVGRHVLADLARRGYRVRVVLRPDQPMPDGAEVALHTPDAFVEAVDWWRVACEQITTVVHCAWHVPPGEYLSSPRNTECLLGTLKMGQGALQAGVERFVGIGTCFEYDLNSRILSTETPLAPITPYASAKAATFHGLNALFTGTATGFSWARLFYLYGEGEKPGRLVSYLRAQLEAGQPAALTHGTQIRDFMDVSDAGKQIVKLAMSDHEGAANICSGVPMTTRQLAENIADLYGRRDLLQFGERPENLVEPDCVLGIPTRLSD